MSYITHFIIDTSSKVSISTAVSMLGYTEGSASTIWEEIGHALSWGFFLNLIIPELFLLVPLIC